MTGPVPTNHSTKLTARRLLDNEAPHDGQLKRGLKKAARGAAPHWGHTGRFICCKPMNKRSTSKRCQALRRAGRRQRRHCRQQPQALPRYYRPACTARSQSVPASGCHWGHASCSPAFWIKSKGLAAALVCYSSGLFGSGCHRDAKRQP